jgi:polyadenylation factor subunit 2
VRSCDWHPTKGLIVSGSKDHRVKLWESRSGKCLTTLSSSKNLVTKTVFEKTQGTLLATCGKDQIVRIFDLRMMRDVLMLRGHDSEVTSLAWHPTHRNLLSTGGQFGAIHHYLLDEQNQPPGIPVTLSPYDAPDPSTAPAQTLYPAHSVLHAHESNGPIWSMSWHPLGHILVSGSNDRATRFWSRPRPGDTSYLMDRFHIGQQAAEERGTYSRLDGRRLAREAEEMEAMDEAEGLQEQSAQPAAAVAQLPGITAGPALPGIAQPQPQGGMPVPPPIPGALGPLPLPPAAAAAAAAAAGFVPPQIDPGRLREILGSGDMEQIKAMFGGALPPLPPPGGMGFPPMPGFPPPPPGMVLPFGGANGKEVNGGGFKRPAPNSFEEDGRRKQARNR